MLANQIKKYKEASFTVIKLNLILGHKVNSQACPYKAVEVTEARER